MMLSGGVSRVAKGADCKSAAVWLRRFESFFPHHIENARENRIFASVFYAPVRPFATLFDGFSCDRSGRVTGCNFQKLRINSTACIGFLCTAGECFALIVSDPDLFSVERSIAAILPTRAQVACRKFFDSDNCSATFVDLNGNTIRFVWG